MDLSATLRASQPRSGLTRLILFKELSIRFYKHTDASYAGIDPHARTMFTHIPNENGKTVFEADLSVATYDMQKPNANVAVEGTQLNL